MRKSRVTLMLAVGLIAGMLMSKPEKLLAAGSPHPGYKKVFLRQHCKMDSAYLCYLGPIIVIK